jgi:FMN phosphatase YigB (HAD superfamily)
MKKYLMSLMILGAIQVKTNAKNLWVYFDLGNTVINVKDKKSFKYFEGSREYITQLKEFGFKIGVISNIPESFGPDYETKLKTLKQYISSRWSEEERFDWDIFDNIYLPLSNDELKPAPILYQRALGDNGNTKSLFISETPKEVEAAQNLGFAGHVFHDDAHDLYIPIEEVEEFIQNNSKIGDTSIL